MFRSLQPGNIGHIGGASRNGGFTPVPVPAVLISATVSNAQPSQVTAVFDKAITSAAYATGITIKIGGVSVTSLATATGSPSATIVFTFTETVVYGDPLTISYNSATGDYVDSDTLNVGSFTDTAVTNNVIDVPSQITSGMWSIADAASGGDANVTIISLPAANGATITDIEYKVGAGSWTSSAGTSDFSIAGFTDGVSTAVLIRAKNSVGSGADSDSKSVTTTAASSAMKVLFEATDYHDFTAPTATQKICLAGRMKVKSTSYAYVIGTDFDTYVRQFTNFRFKGEITASGSQAFLASVLSAGVAVNDVLSFLAWADADNYYLWVSKNGATPVTTTGANDIALGVSDTYKMPRYMNAVNGSGGLASTFEMWDYIWYGSDIPTHATSQALWDLFFDGSAVGKAITATVGGVTADVFENGNAASWPTLTGGALSDV